MTTFIHRQVEAARSGNAPDLICRVPSGWVFLCEMQFLRGYCILNSDPVVASLNDLNTRQRMDYLNDMALVGDALMEVTGAHRINYAIFGNQEPALHAHIIPRFLSEPDQYRTGSPFSYPQEQIDARRFDTRRDAELLRQLAVAIQERLFDQGPGSAL